MRKALILLSALVLFGCTAKEASSPVLTIEGGQVQGVAAPLKGVTVYRGIPYAAAPIGDLRWKEPQPVTPWKGVKVCDTFGHPGFQSVHYPGGYTTEWGYGKEQPYSEDCLYLNVWTTAPGKTDAKMPVALWIHGGGYREGWGSEPEFEGSEWAAKGIVLVSINYRLGVFGFLTHPELAAESPHGVSGNYGILDQIESLKWIQKNIAQFGGDPDNVTIFGQSAGAGSVKTLVASPLTAGLIDKAVIMSGGGLNVPQPQAAAPAANPARGPVLSPEEQAARNKEIFDWAGYDSLEKMRRAGTTEVYALPTIYGGATGQRASLTGSPVVDGWCNVKSFDDACLDGSVADIPYMMGYTMNDMGNMSAAIAAFCLNREEKGNKAWAYEFARPLPDDGSEPGVTARLKGAFHSSDLWFVFKTLQYCWRPWTQGDWDLSEKILTAWTNFAKYGDPNGKDGGDWAACTQATPKFMVFKLDKDNNEASELTDPVTELGY
ncbi:MAG: carboxylesterase family protein [Bacteroidales bacterium]|nr:carboxylesterase family protein [Bacteroidales bacterium]